MADRPPINHGWEWPIDTHQELVRNIRIQNGNSSGDVTPTQHVKLHGKYSYPTASSLLTVPGPLIRPQSTPSVATESGKPVKVKSMLSNLLKPTHRAASLDSHLSSHVTQVVGLNLMLTLPKEAILNPDHFESVENQDSDGLSVTPTSGEGSSDFVMTKGEGSTSTGASQREESPFRSLSPLSRDQSNSPSSSPHSREASPSFVPQKIYSTPDQSTELDRIILFKPPISRRSISRENAIDVSPELNPASDISLHASHARAQYRASLSRSISESQLLWIKEDRPMPRTDSAEVLNKERQKGVFRFYSRPASPDPSKRSVTDETKKGKRFQFLSSKRNRQKKTPESRSILTIPILSAHVACEVGPKTCPLPMSVTMPTNQAGAVKGVDFEPNKLESPVLSQKKKKMKLHNPKNMEALIKDIHSRKYDILEKDENEDTPLHAIVRSDRRDKLEVMIALLVHSDYGCADIDFPAFYGNTALHVAVQKVDILAVKTLLAFGADINALNYYKKTPLDILEDLGAGGRDGSTSSDEERERSWLTTTLVSLKAKHGSEGDKKKSLKQVPRLSSFSVDFPELQEKFDPNLSVSESLKLVDYEEGKSLISLAQKLEFNLNILYKQVELLDNPDTEFAIGIQQFELQRWRSTSSSPIQFEVQGGSRLLFLDGGGIKGLVQIEILSRLEEMTGRRIVDLFDWIVGCSTGGIVALALVYAKKSLAELRQMYFKLKEQIFASPRFGFAYNTEALEALLKETLGSEIRMCDVREPKVMVAAVSKRTTKLELRFFNNCFDDQYSKELVWKVARYTSAAPMYFSEMDHYVDGGVMANNPCEYGLSAIQNYHRDIKKKLDIACVVSIGTGVYPEEGLGSTDAHKFLFFGKHWFNFELLKKRATNLMTLITTALLDSESVAANCRSRCKEQRIPFYRFSPTLETVIASGETDDQKLIEMLTRTKLEATNKWTNELKELVELFHTVAEMSKKQRLLHLRHQRRARLL